MRITGLGMGLRMRRRALWSRGAAGRSARRGTGWHRFVSPRQDWPRGRRRIAYGGTGSTGCDAVWCISGAGRKGPTADRSRSAARLRVARATVSPSAARAQRELHARARSRLAAHLAAPAARIAVTLGALRMLASRSGIRRPEVFRIDAVDVLTAIARAPRTALPGVRLVVEAPVELLPACTARRHSLPPANDSPLTVRRPAHQVTEGLTMSAA